MVKVITYGTFDLLHYGHIRLLERAKALGDYLIVGVTADDFDKKRGKINVQQSLMERVDAVRATGLADEIIIEEYEGQKIDDIQKYDIDIFAIGSDWKGKFDYLNEYCKVIYLERTKGVSSTQIREKNRFIKLGLVGDSLFLNKIITEVEFVNGVQVSSIFTHNCDLVKNAAENEIKNIQSYDNLLKEVDAVYIRSLPNHHYQQIKKALNSKKHVLCESPISLSKEECEELFLLAKEKKCILMEAIKTAYATAFTRLLLLIKAGKIGSVVSVDAVCTSLKNSRGIQKTDWNGFYEWAPTALLPVFLVLGNGYQKREMAAYYNSHNSGCFVKMDFVFDHAVASIKVGDGVKSEGELIISGTEGYIYVPAPWWKTDYFEIRKENQEDNTRYFYQLEGEGIRYELVAFARAIESGRSSVNIPKYVTTEIAQLMEEFIQYNNYVII